MAKSTRSSYFLPLYMCFIAEKKNDYIQIWEKIRLQKNILSNK